MKHYADRDVEKQGQAYADHVSAMTSEGLHTKSAIAAELAHRDIVIADLERELVDAQGDIRDLESELRQAYEELSDMEHPL